MTAVALRLRAELRARWRSWLALGVAIGVAGGVVVALATAASRTQGAFGRFVDATAAGDAFVDAGFGFGDPDLDVGRFAHLPQVVRFERSLHVAIVSRSRWGRSIYPLGPDPIQYFAPSDDRAVDTIDAPQLLRGRLPDPDRADEALADPRALQILGIELGDNLVVRVVSRRAIVEEGSALDLSVDPRSRRATRWGPLATVRIVGVRAQAKLDADGGYINFTRAFRRANGGAGIGAWVEELAVRLRRGQADVPGFRAAVARNAGSRPYGLFEPGTSRPVIQRSIDLVAGALRVLTVVAAAAVLLLGGQALLRASAVEASTGPTLRALGTTTRQLVALGAARGAVMAVPAAVAAAVTATLLSAAAPVGWARDLDPDRGLQVDGEAIGIGVATVAASMTVVGALAAWRAMWAGRGRARGSSTRSDAFAAMLARAGLPVAAVTGVRLAIVRRAGATTVPVRATLTSAVVAVTVAVGALTFAESLAHLLHTPALYGQTWDYETGFGAPLERASVRAAVRDPAVSDLAEGYLGQVEVGGRLVGARATANLKGVVEPAVLEGRAPRADDEILLGTRTLETLRVHIGDAVTIRHGDRATRLRIVGRGVLPTDKWNALGQGAAMRLTALRRILPRAPSSVLMVRFAPGSDRRAAVARMERLFGSSAAVRPQEVSDFGRVDAMPALIMAAFGLAATAALAHLLLTSVRRRRRDLAIFKTLGFTRGQVMAAVAWQATTVAAVGVLVGVPLGLAVGRFGWNVFAGDLHVVPQPITPVAASLLAAPLALLVANAIAALPARGAAATRPATVLRAE